MRFLLRTLSLSYVARHRAKTFLTLLGVVVGVATYVAVAGARDSLLGGIRDTVDRMAGKAQLQLTQEGGVPEALQEAIRERPGIRAQSPVIEQVVVVDVIVVEGLQSASRPAGFGVAHEVLRVVFGVITTSLVRLGVSGPPAPGGCPTIEHHAHSNRSPSQSRSADRGRGQS